MAKQMRQYDQEFKDQAVRLYMSCETSYPKLGKELEVPSSTLATWVREYSKNLKKDTSSTSLSVHEEMMKLRKQVIHLREERDILKKPWPFFKGESLKLYRFMKLHQHEYKVEKMANTLGVSRSGYYKFIENRKCVHQGRDNYLSQRIKALFEESRQTYGSPRIYSVLKTEGEKVSCKRIARLIKEYKFIARKKQRFKVTPKVGKGLPVAKNLLQRDFKALGSNQKWVSDITYIWTSIGWLYVAVVLDLFSRQVVGLSMSQRQTKDLVIRALHQAILHRGQPCALIHHCDRGSQYASSDYQNLLKAYGITSSMSGTGNCYDNAVMESFFATLKGECIFFERYENR